jgi:hypothetical protein
MPDDQSRASSTASFQMGDRFQDDASRRIRQWGDQDEGQDVEVSIQIAPVSLSAAAVLQNEQEDAQSGRPSSKPGGRCRILAAQISGGQNVANLNADIQAVASQNWLGLFPRNRASDGILLPLVARAA